MHYAGLVMVNRDVVPSFRNSRGACSATVKTLKMPSIVSRTALHVKDAVDRSTRFTILTWIIYN